MRWRDLHDILGKIKFLAVEIGSTIIFVYFVAREVVHTIAR
jgi:hypothetical protein